MQWSKHFVLDSKAFSNFNLKTFLRVFSLRLKTSSEVARETWRLGFWKLQNRISYPISAKFRLTFKNIPHPSFVCIIDIFDIASRISCFFEKGKVNGNKQLNFKFKSNICQKSVLYFCQNYLLVYLLILHDLHYRAKENFSSLLPFRFRKKTVD